MMERLAQRLAHGDKSKTALRTAYGQIGGIVGILVNALLAGAKLFAGVVSGSVSISADAVNNLSDAASSCVTLIGFRIAKKPADKDHPYGHGRSEYIAALAVSFFILLMGVELLSSSIERIRTPQAVTYSTAALVILILSIAAKLWLAWFNHALDKKTGSAAAKAVVADSLSDTAATAVALAALVLSRFTSVPVDGWFGVVVAVFIFRAGIGTFKDTVDLLLGKSPSPEFVSEIEEAICSYDGILGVHDLIIHDYGPGRSFASAHAEVPANVDVMHSHDTVDLIERDLLQKYGLHISIHMDPIVTDDARVDALRTLCGEVLEKVDPVLRFHDFRVVQGPTHTNLIFDVVVPAEYKTPDDELVHRIAEYFSKIDERYFCVITVDRGFN